MQRIAILTHQDISLFELACAVELFALPRADIENWYRAEVVSLSPEAKQAMAGLVIQCKTVRSLSQYDTLIVPSWPLDQPIPEKLATQVQRHAVQGKRILTFCSGSFLLAELGLLDNRSAMTHWRYADEFKQRYPKVNYIENELFTLDNELGCSAGSAAGIDLGLAVIAEDFGRAIANKVARRMVVSTQRQGGQTQFVQSPVPVVKNQFAASLDWALQNLNEGVDVNGLADKANMSRRSFDRKFRATFNVSPNVWLIEQRITRVKELLENETWSIDRISELAGFETATTMRFHFSKQVGIPPTAYRQQFGVR